MFKWPPAHPPCLKLITWLESTVIPDHGWRHAAVKSSSEGLQEDCVQIAGDLREAVKGNGNVMPASCTEWIVSVDKVKFDGVWEVTKTSWDRFCVLCLEMGAIQLILDLYYIQPATEASLGSVSQKTWPCLAVGPHRFCLTWLKSVIEAHSH